MLPSSLGPWDALGSGCATVQIGSWGWGDGGAGVGLGTFPPGAGPATSLVFKSTSCPQQPAILSPAGGVCSSS